MPTAPQRISISQEILVSENIINLDVTLASQLFFEPAGPEQVTFFVNGLIRTNGSGFDYTVSGVDITWLAATGTAPNMSNSDVLVAVYVKK